MATPSHFLKKIKSFLNKKRAPIEWKRMSEMRGPQIDINIIKDNIYEFFL